MIVTFSSPAAPDVRMFGDVARQLLETLGKDVTAWGVLTPREFPQALALLGALPVRSATPGEVAGRMFHAAEPGAEPHQLVPMGIRATPFVWMIQRAAQENAFILWSADEDAFVYH